MGLLEVDSNVLAQLWPPDRVVMGLRVNRILRRALLEHVRNVVLWRSPSCGGKQYLELRAWSVKSSLSRFQAECSELSVTVKKSKRFMPVFLRALGETIASALCPDLVQLDLTGNQLTNEDDVQLDVLMHCTRLTKLTIASNKLNFTSYYDSVISGIQHCTALTHLDLRNNKISDEGLDRLAAVLMVGCVNLKELDLSWNKLSSKATISMATVLAGCGMLDKLVLDGNSVDEAAVRNILKQLTSLTALGLSDTDIATMGFLHPSSTLRVLDLSFCDLREAFATALPSLFATCPTITHLDLGGCSLGSISRLPGVASWMPDGGVCPLQWLSVDGNRLGWSGFEELSEAVAACTGLTHLSLRTNAIGDRGGALMASCLSRLTRLSHLDMGHTTLGTHGVVAVAEALCSCRRLQFLSLEGNKSGLLALANLTCALQHGNLTELDLGSASLRPPVASEESLDQGFSPLAALLEATPRLRRLTLSDNTLPLDLLSRVTAAISSCSALTSLHVSQLRCGPRGVVALCAAVEYLPCLRQLTMQKMHALDPDCGPRTGEHCVVRMLRVSTSLRDLDLAQAVQHASVDAMSECAAAVIWESSRLHKLSLAQCRLNLSLSALRSLCCCHAARALDLSCNTIARGGVQELVQVVRHTTALARLNVQGSLEEDSTALEQECRRRDVQLTTRISLFGSDSDSDSSDNVDSEDD